MGALLVTVAGPQGRRQLSLSGDWPIRDLLPLLVDYVGETPDETGSWVLRSGDRNLPEEQSLTDCGVDSGATLVLDRVSARSPSPVEVAPLPTQVPSLQPPQSPSPRLALPPAQPVRPALLPSPTPPPRPVVPQQPEPADVPRAPRQSQPSTRSRRSPLVAVGTVAILLLAGAGAWWTTSRQPPPEPPAPPASPTAPPTRGLPPIVDLSAVVHGTIVGTDSIQVGYFSRTQEGAAEAAHNYLWALAGSDDASSLLKQIAVPGSARSLMAAAQVNKDLLLEQFYNGFRTVQPTVQSYDPTEPVITMPATGVPFEVRLRWVDDPTGGDWKLASVTRPDTAIPVPQPSSP